jgi:hypothetical protein
VKVLGAIRSCGDTNFLEEPHSLTLCCHPFGFLVGLCCQWLEVLGVGMVVCRDGWSLWEIKINSQDSEIWCYLTIEGLPFQANIFRSLDDLSRCVNLQ